MELTEGPQETPNWQARCERVLELVGSGNIEEAEKLLWGQPFGQDWFAMMAPVIESAGDFRGQSNRPVALWCYEQAQALYRAECAGATSGGEARVQLMEGIDRSSHLGRKIWLLKS